MESYKPIRIAQIVGKLLAGGVENVLFNYYREFDKDRIQFDFYYDADSTVEPPSALAEMGAEFIKIPPYQNTIAYIKSLRSHFIKRKYTIVHAHINTLCVFPLYVAWSCGVPVRIAHSHSVPGGMEIKRNLVKYFLRQFDKVFATDYFACSEKAGRWMFGNKAFDDNKVRIMKNAIDYCRFGISDAASADRKTILGVEDRFVVGHVGRFTYAKNHPFLIEVFNEICKYRDDAILLLVGDGELHEDIVNHIKMREISDKVLMTGQVTNPEDFYNVISVMVIPSFYEGLSLTTIESQASGIPAVVSYAVPEEAIISDGVKRLSIKAGAKEWAECIIAVAENDVNLINGRKDEYDIKIQCRKLQSWYLNRVEEYYENSQCNSTRL